MILYLVVINFPYHYCQSHLWPENQIYRTENKQKQNVPYHVPCILKLHMENNKMIRPIQKKEMIFFTPFLIHGAGVNFKETRIGMELRFPKFK